MRYYFHIMHLDYIIMDEEGAEFAGLVDARIEAELDLQELVARGLMASNDWSIVGIRIGTLEVAEVAVILVDAAIQKIFRDR